MHRYLYLSLVTFILVLSGILRASPSRAAPGTPTTWYVATWGNDNNNCLSWATACRTIGQALYNADDGDIIYVGPGTYKENIRTFSGVTIIGAGPNRTILDGDRADSVLTNYSDRPVSVSRLMLRNGSGQDIGRGGGVTSWGPLTLDTVVVTNNVGDFRSSAGAISSSGPLTVTNSAIISNTAPVGFGGVLIDGPAYMENVTIAYNKAISSGEAGALVAYARAKVTLVNVTISQNESFFSCGGIRNDGEMTLTNVTLAGNTVLSPRQQQVDLRNNGRVTFQNTLIAGICLGSGTFTSMGGNLESGATCHFTQNTDKQNTAPKIAPLAYNGGLGYTHALKPNSPAIDAGIQTACPLTDQRGMARWDGDADGTTVCDIGAYEFVPAGVLQKNLHLPYLP